MVFHDLQTVLPTFRKSLFLPPRAGKRLFGPLFIFSALQFGLGLPLVCYAELSGSVTGTTNYIWRGYSKSDDHLAVRSNLDYEHSSGVFLGTWVSTVDFDDHGFADRAQVEIAPYLGWTTGISDDWRLDIQWIRYLYDGKIFGGPSPDYNEFSGLIHFRDLVSARIGFSENYYNRSRPSADFELNGRYALLDWLEFSAGIGFSLTREVLEYDFLYWNAGISSYYRFIELDLRYAQGTEVNAKDPAYRNRWRFEPRALGPTVLFSVTLGF